MDSVSREGKTSIRKRFVQRAHTLIKYQPFLDDLDNAIATWNTAYPMYAISTRRGLPPEDVNPAVGGILYPPRLQREWGDWQPEFLIDPACFLQSDGEPSEDDLADAEHAKVPILWCDIIKRLWSTWWPAERFPNWANGKTDHPCQRFVSACLIWRPNQIEIELDEWIEKHPASVSWTHHDLSGDAPKPQADEEYYRTLYQQTMGGLQAAIQRGETITGEVLSREAWAAHEDAEAARISAITEMVYGGAYPYVWLYPGLRSTDWHDLRQDAIAAANKKVDFFTNGCLPWEDQARRMYAEDLKKNKSKIAFELGLTTDQIRRLRLK